MTSSLVAIAALSLSAGPFHLRFANIAIEPGARNEVISPLSFEVLVEMLRLGARGDTRTGLLKLLAREEGDSVSKLYRTLTDPAPPDEPHASQDLQIPRPRPRSNLLDSIDLSSHRAEVLLHSSVWALDQLQVRENYRSLLGALLDTTVVERPQLADEEVRLINEWVREKTKGKIPRAVNDIPPPTAISYVSTLYFKGGWAVPFNVHSTQARPFTLESGAVVQVPTMRNRDLPARVGESHGFTSILMSYADPDYEMMLVLPPLGVPATAALREMSPDLFTALQRAESKRVFLELPKVKIASRLDLNTGLQRLGFLSLVLKGDFSDVSPALSRGLAAASFGQAAMIEWDEIRTEAAAVSLGFLMFGSSKPDLELKFNRPFLYYLMHRPTSTVLICGVVHNPLEN
jgi:serpin B